jgi:hypothetical protein
MPKEKTISMVSENKLWYVGGGIGIVIIVLLIWILATLPSSIDYKKIENAFSSAVQKIPKPVPIDYQKIAKVLEKPIKALNEAAASIQKSQVTVKEAPPERDRPPVPYPLEFMVDRSKGVRYKVVGNRIHMFFVLLDSKKVSKFQKKLAKEKFRLIKSGKTTTQIQKHMNKMISEAGDSEFVYRFEAGPYTPAVFDKIMQILKNSPLLQIKGLIGWAPDDEGKLWLNTADPDFLESLDYGVAELGPPDGSHLSEDMKKVLRKYKRR